MHTKYNNKEAKRISTMKEHLSNAALIGLANLYGVDMMVKVPTVKGSTELVTNTNVTVQETSLSRNVQSLSHDTIAAMTNPLESRKDKQVRNAKRSVEALMLNQLAEYIFMCDPCLQCEMTKRRPTQKSVKLLKFKRIDPFNEEGFRVFGERVIEIIGNISRSVESDKKKHTIFYLPQNQPEIMALYCELLGRKELLTERGRIYSESISSTSGSDGGNSQNMF